jgi:hypothetical protein
MASTPGICSVMLSIKTFIEPAEFPSDLAREVVAANLLYVAPFSPEAAPR